VPRTVCKKVPVSYTVRVPRTVVMKVPVETGCSACGGVSEGGCSTCGVAPGVVPTTSGYAPESTSKVPDLATPKGPEAPATGEKPAAPKDDKSGAGNGLSLPGDPAPEADTGASTSSAPVDIVLVGNQGS
jgi:hypothetical protein